MVRTGYYAELAIKDLEKLVMLAEEANKNQVQGYRRGIDEIFWNSFNEKRRSAGVKDVGSVIYDLS